MVKNRDLQLFAACALCAIIIPMLLFGVDVYNDSVDLQLHDAYFTFRPFEFSVAILGPILFNTFLIRGINTSFKNRLTVIFLLIGALLVFLLVYWIYEIASHLM